MTSDLLNGLVFAVVFAAVWAGAGFVMAAGSGWRALALHYRQRGPFGGELPGSNFRWIRRATRCSGEVEFRWLQAGRLRWGANYGRCLVVGCGPSGLRLAVLVPFRIGHPPLVIPWSDVPAAPTERRFGPFKLVEFRFARDPTVPVRVRPSLARWILDMRRRSEKALDTSGTNP